MDWGLPSCKNEGAHCSLDTLFWDHPSSTQSDNGLEFIWSPNKDPPFSKSPGHSTSLICPNPLRKWKGWIGPYEKPSPNYRIKTRLGKTPTLGLGQTPMTAKNPIANQSLWTYMDERPPRSHSLGMHSRHTQTSVLSSRSRLHTQL